MKRTFIIVLGILLILTFIAGYYIYNIRKMANLSQKHNQMYEEVKEEPILGTTLISVINKAIDDNEKNAVSKKQNSIYYEENETNSIKITVKFLELEDSVQMEAIAEQQSENFVKHFATATFKCTKIEYHEKTNFVKSMFFEQVKPE